VTDGPDVDGLWRPAPLDVLAGWAPGQRPDLVEPLPPPGGSPLEALEDVLRPLLATAPCLVAFSGGRDSSLLLAVAVRVSRREGLAPPVAYTWRYPGHADADETSWQELVVRELGVAEWVRVDANDDADLLGTTATETLRRTGVLFPPRLGTAVALARAAAGGSVVTGEGGDEYLGGGRNASLAYVANRRGRVPVRRLPVLARHLAREARPTVPRRRDRPPARPWLRPEAERLVDAALAADRPPFGFAGRVDWLRARRATLMGTANLTELARREGAALVHPLVDPGFLAALRAAGGRLGWANRTLAFRALFPDLLPAALAARRTKASFNGPVFGTGARRFARVWDGSGVDAAAVDVAALRAAWLSPTPSARTTLLLHQAWLASRRQEESSSSRDTGGPRTVRRHGDP